MTKQLLFPVAFLLSLGTVTATLHLWQEDEPPALQRPECIFPPVCYVHDSRDPV